MANRFYGSYRATHGKLRGKTGPRGIQREVQAEKHEEAIARNMRTPHPRTKQHQRRCTFFGKNACELA